MQIEAMEFTSGWSADDCNLRSLFKATILYDDLSAGKRAINVLDKVRQQAGNDVQMCPQPWRFDMLSDPQWAVMAMEEAALADMLIVSTSDGNALPAHVEGWIELCLARKRGHEGAVVALPGVAGHCQEAKAKPMNSLRRKAQAAGQDFFAPASTKMRRRRKPCPQRNRRRHTSQTSQRRQPVNTKHS